jgi:hypothetical protein
VPKQEQTNRFIRRLFRKRLLPLVEQCLLGRAIQHTKHYDRQELDRQAASEILACFESPYTWLSDYATDDLLRLWYNWRAGTDAGEVSIGNFCQYLYDNQVTEDQADTEGNQLDVIERRLYLLATLYTAGFVEKFAPEELAIT